MKLHDVTLPLRSGMVTWPGDPEVRLSRVQSIADGDVANVSRLDFGVHSGTHVDAPLHFVGGGPDVTSLPLEQLVADVVVVDATGLDEIGGDLELPQGATRILLKTRNSELWAKDEFDEGFVRVTPDGARLLLSKGVRLVGVDYLSVGDVEVHLLLLELGVIVVEGLDLRGIEPGPYRMLCLPLKLEGSDGAPARVVLVEE